MNDHVAEAIEKEVKVGAKREELPPALEEAIARTRSAIRRAMNDHDYKKSGVRLKGNS